MVILVILFRLTQEILILPRNRAVKWLHLQGKGGLDIISLFCSCVKVEITTILLRHFCTNIFFKTFCISFSLIWMYNMSLLYPASYWKDKIWVFKSFIYLSVFLHNSFLTDETSLYFEQNVYFSVKMYKFVWGYFIKMIIV